VDPRSAGRSELPGSVAGIVVVDLLAGEVALAEPDDVAVTQVDGGQDHEGH
jgi:hypothetical protein